jgi:ABC-2 type transport system ATP-binding protein
MNAISFENVHRTYRRDQEILSGVSFAVEAGSVVGLLGQNGAGKTTLIRIAMGLIEPQEGRALVLGMDPREKPIDVKRRVGYVSEDQLLPPFLTVERIVDLHRSLFRRWDDAMASALIRRFEIPPRARIRDLSKGQARRVALLCAVAHRPEVLLLDEPASGLDPAARREFLETSIRLLNEEGTTILFSSHYMTDVERLAERIVMIHHGGVLIDDGLDRLKECFCLAMIPHDPTITQERILSIDSCIGVRERPESVHAILRLAPGDACGVVGRALGIPDVRCQTINLEEMFIELAGGER